MHTPLRAAHIALPAVAAVGLALTGCSVSTTHTSAPAPSTPAAAVATTQVPATSAPVTVRPTTTTTTLPPCGLGVGGGTVPVGAVCASDGAPHFTTPQAAMTYLAAAWNARNVRELDYVTDPAGRMALDAMANEMPDLHFSSCDANPAGDYTCYFHHRIVPSTSPTTYPNPNGYPAGEAVFTVGPAAGPGWYLTQVLHCG